MNRLDRPKSGTGTRPVMREAVTATTADPSRYKCEYFRNTCTGTLTDTSQHLSLAEGFPAIGTNQVAAV